MRPPRCVVDTNVVATADGANEAASPECRAASAMALSEVMKRGHLFIDAGGEILNEYLGAVGAGQPDPGGAFVRWVLQNQWVATAVSRVVITRRVGGPTSFLELPAATEGVRYDPSDEKFLAVAAAHPERPPVLQSLDSKWWAWQESLQTCGVSIHFVCPAEIKAKHLGNMGE